MRFTLILILGLIYCGIISAQNALDSTFRNIKEGALLVRLQTKENFIAKVEVNNLELAKQIAMEQVQKNKSIVKAFTQNFEICPVYYFYAVNSTLVKSKSFELVLLDSSFNIATPIPKLSNNYLIAEFSQAHGDSMHHEAKVNTYDEHGKVTSSRDTTVIYHSGYSIDALVLLDDAFNPLQKPYPRYVRQNVIVRARTYTEMVSLLNSKIKKYLQSTRR